MMKPSTPRTGTRRARSFPPAEQLERRVLLSADVGERQVGASHCSVSMVRIGNRIDGSK